jgi:hypothetical protein
MLRLEKSGDAPRAALRFALCYLMIPLWGVGNEKTRGRSVSIIALSPHRVGTVPGFLSPISCHC